VSSRTRTTFPRLDAHAPFRRDPLTVGGAAAGRWARAVDGTVLGSTVAIAYVLLQPESEEIAVL
jgi:hypothetical protein